MQIKNQLELKEFLFKDIFNKDINQFSLLKTKKRVKNLNFLTISAFILSLILPFYFIFKFLTTEPSIYSSLSLLGITLFALFVLNILESSNKLLNLCKETITDYQKFSNINDIYFETLFEVYKNSNSANLDSDELPQDPKIDNSIAKKSTHLF